MADMAALMARLHAVCVRLTQVGGGDLVAGPQRAPQRGQGRIARRRPGAVQKQERDHVIASSRSFDMSPGTMVIGTGKRAGAARHLRDQRSRPLAIDTGAENQHPDLGVGTDLVHDLGHRFALADHQLRVDPLAVAHPLGEDLEMRLDPLARFLAHDVADADPVVEFLGRDHRQDRHAAPGMRRAHRREAHGVQAFAAVIQHDKELAHVGASLSRRIIDEGWGRAISASLPGPGRCADGRARVPPAGVFAGKMKCGA